MPYPVFDADSFSIPFALLAVCEAARKLGATKALHVLVCILSRHLAHPEGLPYSAARASKELSFASARTMRTALKRIEGAGVITVRRRKGRRGNHVRLQLADVSRTPAESAYLEAWCEAVSGVSLEKDHERAAFCLLVVLCALLSKAPCKAFNISRAELCLHTGLSVTSLAGALDNLQASRAITYREHGDRLHIALAISLPR